MKCEKSAYLHQPIETETSATVQRTLFGISAPRLLSDPISHLGVWLWLKLNVTGKGNQKYFSENLVFCLPFCGSCQAFQTQVLQRLLLFTRAFVSLCIITAPAGELMLPLILQLFLTQAVASVGALCQCPALATRAHISWDAVHKRLCWQIFPNPECSLHLPKVSLACLWRK